MGRGSDNSETTTAARAEITYECADCGRQAPASELPDAKDLSLRMEPGDTYTDKECPDCGALCFPVEVF